VEERHSLKIARSGAPALFDATSDVVGDVVSDAVGNVVSEGVAESGKGVESEGVVSGTVAALAAALASGLASDVPADLEFECGKLRLALELAAWVGAVVGLDLEWMLVSGFETKLAPNFTPEFFPVLSSVPAARVASAGFSSTFAPE